MPIMEELMSNSLFKGLSETKLEKVVVMAKDVTFPAGFRIFSEGDRAGLLYVVQEGIIDLTFSFKVGTIKSEITIETKGKGDSIGWSAVISPHTYTLSGVSRDQVQALAFDGENLLRACKEDSGFGTVFMGNIAELVGSRLTRLQSMFIQEVQRGVSVV